MIRKEFKEAVKIDRSKEGDRLRAAAIVSEMNRDDEMAETLRTLSSQMDFAENSEAEEAIERTRQKLDKLIEERQKRNASAYHKLALDEDILEKSGGCVTALGYSRVESRFLEKGLFDPKIFGGTGKILSIESGREKISVEELGLGEGIGHIELPCRTVLPQHYNIVANLLGLNSDDVMRVVKYNSSIVVDPGSSELKKGTLISEEDAYNARNQYDDVVISIGGDAIYDLLKGLGYGDHPERLAFKVVPVISPILRPAYYVKDMNFFFVAPLNEPYMRLINHVNRCNGGASENVPLIILWSKYRLVCDLVDELADEIIKVLEKKVQFVGSKQVDSKWSTAQLAYVCRKNILQYDVSVSEKNGEIESLGIYPDMIKLQNDDGSFSDISFADVIKHNDNVSLDYEVAVFSSNCDDFEYDDEEEDEEYEDYEEDEEIRDVSQEGLGKIEEATENLWDEAAEKKENLIVKLDAASNLYVPA